MKYSNRSIVLQAALSDMQAIPFLLKFTSEDLHTIGNPAYYAAK
jgi:hypothetical protein